MEITWKGSDFNVYTRNGSNSVILSSVLRWPSIQLIVDCKKDKAKSGSRNKTMRCVRDADIVMQWNVVNGEEWRVVLSTLLLILLATLQELLAAMMD
nr:hypothetical protein BgiMline_016297 [Biomphalaria glabrata]